MCEDIFDGQKPPFAWGKGLTMNGDSTEAIAGGAVPPQSAGGGPCPGAVRRLFGRVAALALFCVLIVPLGVVMRALGRDRLRLRSDPDAASYWVVRDRSGGAPGSMASPR